MPERADLVVESPGFLQSLSPRAVKGMYFGCVQLIYSPYRLPDRGHVEHRLSSGVE